MKNKKTLSPKTVVLIAGLVTALLCGVLAFLIVLSGGGILEVPTQETYSYINPDETKAQTDGGITIDGVLDEEAYQNNNWLYLHNDDGGNNVDIAMTSYYGEKGMYFVYDVTESVPIYVNLNRNSYMNSCIEMYFAPSSVTSLKENSYFEVDMLPTGDMVFKKSNGKGGYVNAATTGDMMAHLGATTKGGEVNTEGCYGYCLELFIPWDYMDHLGLDAQAMKDSFVYVDPAHITSHNLTGTDTSVDRYWYFYAQQQGAGFSDVYQYFRFNGDGVLGTVPITFDDGDGYSLSGDPSVIPGMETVITVTPESGRTLTSILVNGQEYIQNVAYGQDGSVLLTVRGQKQGLTVSAATEAVTEGRKTLSGTVKLNKVGGASLEGVRIKYAGPTGEKPITLDAKGNFTLTDLDQGYYTLTVEKEGFTTISRGILLNRDVTTQLTLEYDTFYAELGTSWVLDQQNEGVIHKFGGRGYLLSTDSYSKFTYKANFFYNEALAEEADTDYFQQQRSGMRILFSNGKYWHIDFLKENGNYIVQYAKHSGDNSLFGWKGICQMDAAQIAQYTSEKGIELSVVRDGQYAAVFLAGKLLTVEKLDDEYAKCTAQLGLEYWAANRDILNIPYSISTTTAVDLKNAAFKTAKEWDVSGMFDGKLSVPNSDGDPGWLDSARDDYREVDLRLTLRDLCAADDNYRAAAALSFGNGLNAIYTITNDNSNDDDPNVYVLQTMASSFSKWGVGYTLTAEQVAKLQSEKGLEFRLVRVGDTVDIYLDGQHVREYDLTNTLEGQPSQVADQKAKVQLRLYGNQGKTVTVPFVLKDKVENQVKLDIKSDSKGTVKTDQKTYLLGETVTLSDGGAQGYYCNVILVDGQKVELDKLGKYSFTAQKSSYTVEGTFADRIWNNSKEWNNVQQDQGSLSIPDSDGDSGWIHSYRSDYSDLDMTLILKDKNTQDGNYRTAVTLDFGNGLNALFSVTNAHSDEDDPSVYAMQTMASSFTGWGAPYTLTNQQVAQLQSEEGIELRIVRDGVLVNVYVGGVLANQYDLTNTREGKTSGVGEQPLRVGIRCYGNAGQIVTVPFTITEQAELCPAIFKTGSGWNTAGQWDGTLLVMEKDTDTGWLDSVRNDYKDLDLRLTLKDLCADEGNYRAAVALTFSNNANVIFTVTNAAANDDDPNIYGLQTMPSSFNKWGTYYTLTAQQVAQLQSQDGLEMRLVRVGDTLDIYLAGVHAYELDMTNTKEGQPSGVADLGAKLQLKFFGNYGQSVEVPFQIKEEVELAKLSVVQTTNGTVATDQKNYLVGEQINVTVTGRAGYAHNSFQVNGKNEKTDLYGKYSFTAQEQNAINATFARSLFKPTVMGWWLENQHYGQIGVDYTNANGNSNWLDFADSYLTADITLQAREYDDAQKPDLTRTAVRFMFNNNTKIITFSIAKNTVKGGGYKYSIQSLSGDNIVGTNHDFYMLNEEQIAKFKSEEGIEFRVVRIGTKVNVYLDGVRVVDGFDLTQNNSGVTDAVAANITIRRYDDPGIKAVYGIKVSKEAPQSAVISIPGMENGTVSPERTDYIVGEWATVTVAGAKGYAHDSLTVNGQAALTDLYGKYSFIAKEQNTVTATFARSLFKEGVKNWLLENQHYNQIAISATDNGGNSNWLDFAKQYTDVDITLNVKEYPDSVKPDLTRTIIRFTFTNGKRISFTVAKNKDGDGVKYTVQTMNNEIPAQNFKDLTGNFTAEQIEKLNSDAGIMFRVVRTGTLVDIYLDGVLVVEDFDLTQNNSGVTADMKADVTIRRYDDPGIQAQYYLLVTEPEKS